ncbi:hypothetical protein [Streptomyces sp. NPDC006270]|uniref:hypothetical protein n=1 Tax=Streptomyces sp. NPDC006270 TaxID=3364741 RepID=UPI0036865A0C
MTVRARTAVLVAAAVPVTLAAVLKAGRWQLYADRHCITLSPQPGRACPHCRGAGGWWTGGPFPEMEACGCWSERRELRIRLLPVPARPDEPPF